MEEAIGTENMRRELLSIPLLPFSSPVYNRSLTFACYFLLFILKLFQPCFHQSFCRRQCQMRQNCPPPAKHSMPQNIYLHTLWPQLIVTFLEVHKIPFVYFGKKEVNNFQTLKFLYIFKGYLLAELNK